MTSLNEFKNRIADIDKIKKQIDAFRPIPANILKQLKQYFRIGLTYSSNAIEGNSLTETETKIVLEDGITIGGRSLHDHLEALGHSDAYDLLFKLTKKTTFTEKDILALHKLFYFRIDPQNAGKYRKEQVYITGTEFIPPIHSKVPVLMKKFIESFESWQKKYHPVELAATVHQELVTIHPFVDGNGRCARLLMNLIFLQNGYAVTIIPPILRTQYINALKKSQAKKADPKPFINFITEMAYESQKEYLRLLKA
jgi:Fic family protein